MTKTMLMGAGLALALAASAGSAGATPFATHHDSATSGLTAFTRGIQPELAQYRGGPRYHRGGPGWGYRPWYRRPYYGTIIGGIALGALIGVAVWGVAPPRPSPDLCWYWADRELSRGYWDYC